MDYTYPSVFWIYSVMAMFVVGAVFFLWKAVRSGAVANDESPKYRMLEDDFPAAERPKP
ncbi:MAG: cbb3-type cytochrome oxidase assembly protein [Thermoanaerobaculia bacterium]|nr:cbb3-type cytochrome oxidase assembly protein [Thermoanaerobaculia bacterium]